MQTAIITYKGLSTVDLEPFAVACSKNSLIKLDSTMQHSLHHSLSGLSII
jgi:hypothetical protein